LIACWWRIVCQCWVEVTVNSKVNINKFEFLGRHAYFYQQGLKSLFRTTQYLIIWKVRFFFFLCYFFAWCYFNRTTKWMGDQSFSINLRIIKPHNTQPLGNYEVHANNMLIHYFICVTRLKTIRDKRKSRWQLADKSTNLVIGCSPRRLISLIP